MTEQNDLYRIALNTGTLRAVPFLRRTDSERVVLPPIEEVAVDATKPIKQEKA